MRASLLASSNRLTILVIALGGIVAVITRLIPYEFRPMNFALAGALFLYAGAQSRHWAVIFLPLFVLAGTDLYFLGVKNWKPAETVYASYLIYFGLGWWFLRRSQSPVRIGLFALAGSLQFFVLTNLAVWLEYMLYPELYVGTPYYCPPTFAGLIKCYDQALPFFRGTVMSDMLFTGMLFGLHAILIRRLSPSEGLATSTRPRGVTR